MSAVFSIGTTVWRNKAMTESLDLSLIKKDGCVNQQVGWVTVDGGKPMEVILTTRPISVGDLIREDGLRISSVEEYKKAREREKERNVRYYDANPNLLRDKIRSKRRLIRLLLTIIIV